MLKKKQDFRDIPFFISKNAFTNDLNTIVNLSAIRQSIKNIILTNLGERTFQYNFGCNIYDTLFELMEEDDKIAMQINILSKLQLYEPRIQVNEIYITSLPEENTINITVNFGIPSTGLSDTITLSVVRTR